MNIGFVGLAKLELPVATAINIAGHTVRGYDINNKVIELIPYVEGYYWILWDYYYYYASIGDYSEGLMRYAAINCNELTLLKSNVYFLLSGFYLVANKTTIIECEFSNNIFDCDIISDDIHINNSSFRWQYSKIAWKSAIPAHYMAI